MDHIETARLWASAHPIITGVITFVIGFLVGRFAPIPKKGKKD